LTVATDFLNFELQGNPSDARKRRSRRGRKEHHIKDTLDCFEDPSHAS
jgi:hypothetical protein